jgi:hypothetical protein
MSVKGWAGRDGGGVVSMEVRWIHAGRLPSPLIDRLGPFREAVESRAGILARAHTRSGDAVAISSYPGRSNNFDRALATFAEHYADQNERDYALLKAAVDAGRIEGQSR